jgi:hypothetical protein
VARGAIYAASRINQLRKSSSAASQLRKVKGAEIKISSICLGGVNQRLVRRMGRYLATPGGFVIVSFCYLLLRRLLQLVALRVRSNEWKELEIVVLRHELPYLGAGSAARPLRLLTGSSLPLPAGFSPARAGDPSSSRLRRSGAGIGAWWRSVGRTPDEWVCQRSARKSGSWSCVWREKTRDGDISASWVSSRDLALRCRRPPSAHGCGKMALGRWALAQA